MNSNTPDSFSKKLIISMCAFVGVFTNKRSALINQLIT